MELRNSTVLILGGSGLVGTAIARRLLRFEPRLIVLSGLTQPEVDEARTQLSSQAGRTEVAAVWGNIFLPADLAQLERGAVDSDPVLRRRLLHELFAPLTRESVQQNLLGRWMAQFKPDAVIDCVNTATALAYRDVFASAQSLLSASESGLVTPDEVERHLLTLELPQLLRHVQILQESLKNSSARAYVKIGTSGTGGMGLNIPYTHSEERPSRTLMTKSAVAGAQSLLLFLLGRTPGIPAIIEVKPAAAIGWREIAFGPVRRGGQPVPLVDCERPVPVGDAFRRDNVCWTETGQELENVFIDVGENGLFSRDEFETVTALGQMELVTAEEIADIVADELVGRPTGRNIVAALDSASLGPTYRGGYLRESAVAGLKALEQAKGVRSIAFEMLGPPRLSKLLYEGYMLGQLRSNVKQLAGSRADALAAEARDLLLSRDHGLRRQILSVGLPILLPDAGSVLRGPTVVVPPGSDMEDAVPRGWIDLREANMSLWISRASRIAGQSADPSTGSMRDWDAIDAGAPIVPSQLAVWVFENEDAGFRIKR